MIESIKNSWRNKKNLQGESMHLYVHSPFCLKICKYCMYKSIDIYKTDLNLYENYFNGLLKQIEDFRDIIECNQPDSIYFGGGTPSIMPFEILKKIANLIPHFNDIKVKVFEANPVSMTRDKIDILSQLGFTYLALGVQTLDAEELSRQNRKPPKEGHLKEITEYAIGKGMHVNYDVMTLLNDDLEKDMERVYKDLKLIMEYYKPPSIDIYPMDQKLNNIPHEEILRKIKALRRTIAKVSYFQEDYHVACGMEKVRLDNDDEILKTYKGNYHLLNIKDDIFFGERKAYSCSGPEFAPRSQNVISFGGFQDLWTYSYFADKSFIYYTKINEDGDALYTKERR